MKYITEQELKNITDVVENLNQVRGEVSFCLGLEVKIFDSNGEALGLVTIIDGAEYGFVPNKEDSDA